MERVVIWVGAVVIGGSVVAGAWQDAQSPGQRFAEERMKSMTDPTAMMKWQEDMQPSLAHEVLGLLEGEWDMQVKVRMGQDAPTMDAAFTASAERVMGGLFLEQRVQGLMMGMPVERRLMFGYDNTRQLFHVTEHSNMGSGVSVCYGSLDQTGTVLTVIGDMTEPMSGEVGKAFKMVWHFDAADRYRFEVYEILYGEPFKVIESTGVRRATGSD